MECLWGGAMKPGEPRGNPCGHVQNIHRHSSQSNSGPWIWEMATVPLCTSFRDHYRDLPKTAATKLEAHVCIGWHKASSRGHGFSSSWRTPVLISTPLNTFVINWNIGLSPVSSHLIIIMLLRLNEPESQKSGGYSKGETKCSKSTWVVWSAPCKY